MSGQQSRENTEIQRKASDPSNGFTKADSQTLAEDDASVQTQSRHSSRAALIQACLYQGAWTLTDDDLNIIIIRSNSGKLPQEKSTTFGNQSTPETQTPIEKANGRNLIIDARELKAIVQCSKEQGFRREAVRATRQLQRYRLVERRYLELLQDSIHKDKPCSESGLKRRALEQVMRETRDQTKFPLAPTNDSLSRKIQNFAIKAQRKPYHDIGIWGFAMLRLNYGDDVAWENYKKLIEAGAQKILLGNSVPQHICAMFQFTYLEDETALSGLVDQTKLVKYWEQNRWNEEVHLHINKPFFLSVDEFTREDENPNDPPMYIHDASVDEVKEGAFPGFRRTSVFELIMWHIAGIEKSRLHLRSVWETVHS
jgi:hypothetical protein